MKPLKFEEYERILHPERFGADSDTMKINLDIPNEYQYLFDLLCSKGLIATIAEMDEIIRHSVITKIKIDNK